LGKEEGVAKWIMRLALQHVNDVVYNASVEELRISNASLLTGIDPLSGELRETGSWRKVEANRKLQDYLRGGLEKLKEEDEWQIAAALCSSLSKTFTIIINYSIMDLIGGGYWSTGKASVDQTLIDCALDVIVSVRERVWLVHVNQSLSIPMFYLAKYILDKVDMKSWREEDGYAEGLVKLCELLYWTVVYDAWSRKKAAPKDATQWHYRNDVSEINKMLRKYKKLGLPGTAIVDEYAVYALLILPFLENPNVTDSKGGLRTWQVRIDFKSLKSRAKEFEQLVKEAEEPYYARKVSEVLSKWKGADIPFVSISSLLNGWVGSMFKGIVEATHEGEVLYLRMEEPFPKYYPFDGGEFMVLTARTLAVSRQVAHIYSFLGRLFTEKAKREGLDKRAREIEGRLKLLCSKGRGWNNDELQRILARPLPSIYEQVLHTPTVAIGMAYGALSGISLALKLDPEIPPDPLDLVKLDPVKEKWGEKWSELKERPEFSKSLDLLRSSARLPIGHLERTYDCIETAMELLPPPASPWSRVGS
jgi:hypothetical protein